MGSLIDLQGGFILSGHHEPITSTPFDGYLNCAASLANAGCQSAF
jgi:hypothetical protein